MIKSTECRHPSHPRLKPNAILSNDHVANVMDWTTQEFIIEGQSRGLQGKKLDAFVSKHVKEAKKEVKSLFKHTHR